MLKLFYGFRISQHGFMWYFGRGHSGTGRMAFMGYLPEAGGPFGYPLDNQTNQSFVMDFHVA